MKKDLNYIIIVGCGRFGSTIAESFSLERKSIVVIDKNPNSFKKLSDNFSGFTIESNGIEVDTLISANIETAGILLATTDDDNTNMMIAQIAKDLYHVPKVVARVHNPNTIPLYREFGIQIVSPIELSKIEFENILKNDKGGTL